MRHRDALCCASAARGRPPNPEQAARAPRANVNARRFIGSPGGTQPAHESVPCRPLCLAQRPRSAAGGRATRAPGPLKRDVRRAPRLHRVPTRTGDTRLPIALLQTRLELLSVNRNDVTANAATLYGYKDQSFPLVALLV